MARVFITGSSDGLGLMAAGLLIEQGHEVVLHGRHLWPDNWFWFRRGVGPCKKVSG
jgi:nucleoside-diphosphate-sugar epimerase